MLWHRGDPAGWTRYESLGIRFNSISTGKIEDLWALLLMTPLPSHFKLSKINPLRNKLNSSDVNTMKVKDRMRHILAFLMFTKYFNLDVKSFLVTPFRLTEAKTTCQLLLATRVRTWQGQHYSHVIARLKYSWYFNLDNLGRFNSICTTNAEDLSILPTQKSFKLIFKHQIYN